MKSKKENIIKEKSKKYGEFQNVFFTDEQFEKLKNLFPNDYEDRISKLDDYMQSTGKKYKDCLATLRNWARKEGYKFPSKEIEETKYIEIDTYGLTPEEEIELYKKYSNQNYRNE